MLRPGPVSFFTSAQTSNGAVLADLYRVPGRTYAVRAGSDLQNFAWPTIGRRGPCPPSWQRAVHRFSFTLPTGSIVLVTREVITTRTAPTRLRCRWTRAMAFFNCDRLEFWMTANSVPPFFPTGKTIRVSSIRPSSPTSLSMDPLSRKSVEILVAPGSPDTSSDPPPRFGLRPSSGAIQSSLPPPWCQDDLRRTALPVRKRPATSSTAMSNSSHRQLQG